ncbi:hypothetical protein R1sor_004367 [Riccia sorocarpa]|uniref:Uncharacterized protein n=1 Tax=Riccia sorocarpa TaxID=122646 RepID=A0ABD3HKT5_9MARC
MTSGSTGSFPGRPRSSRIGSSYGGSGGNGLCRVGSSYGGSGGNGLCRVDGSAGKGRSRCAPMFASVMSEELSWISKSSASGEDPWRSSGSKETWDSSDSSEVSSFESLHSQSDREVRMASANNRVAPTMAASSGESEPEAESTLLTKSNVGLFVEDEVLMLSLHDFSEVGMDVKDEKMLAAMPDAAKIWLGVTKSIGKGCRQEFSKLLYAHVYLPNQVRFKNKGLDPFPGRWCSASAKRKEVGGEEPARQRRKRGPVEQKIVDVEAPDGNATLPQADTEPLGSYSIPRASTFVPASAIGGLDANAVSRQLAELLRRVKPGPDRPDSLVG